MRTKFHVIALIAISCISCTRSDVLKLREGKSSQVKEDIDNQGGTFSVAPVQPVVSPIPSVPAITSTPGVFATHITNLKTEMDKRRKDGKRFAECQNGTVPTNWNESRLTCTTPWINLTRSSYDLSAEVLSVLTGSNKCNKSSTNSSVTGVLTGSDCVLTVAAGYYRWGVPLQLDGTNANKNAYYNSLKLRAATFGTVRIDDTDAVPLSTEIFSARQGAAIDTTANTITFKSELPSGISVGQLVYIRAYSNEASEPIALPTGSSAPAPGEEADSSIALRIPKGLEPETKYYILTKTNLTNNLVSITLKDENDVAIDLPALSASEINPTFFKLDVQPSTPNSMITVTNVKNFTVENLIFYGQAGAFDSGITNAKPAYDDATGAEPSEFYTATLAHRRLIANRQVLSASGWMSGANTSGFTFKKNVIRGFPLGVAVKGYTDVLYDSNYVLNVLGKQSLGAQGYDSEAKDMGRDSRKFRVCTKGEGGPEAWAGGIAGAVKWTSNYFYRSAYGPKGLCIKGVEIRDNIIERIMVYGIRLETVDGVDATLAYQSIANNFIYKTNNKGLFFYAFSKNLKTINNVIIDSNQAKGPFYADGFGEDIYANFSDLDPHYSKPWDYYGNIVMQRESLDLGLRSGIPSEDAGYFGKYDIFHEQDFQFSGSDIAFKSGTKNIMLTNNFVGNYDTTHYELDMGSGMTPKILVAANPNHVGYNNRKNPADATWMIKKFNQNDIQILNNVFNSNSSTDLMVRDHGCNSTFTGNRILSAGSNSTLLQSNSKVKWKPQPLCNVADEPRDGNGNVTAYFCSSGQGCVCEQDTGAICDHFRGENAYNCPQSCRPVNEGEYGKISWADTCAAVNGVKLKQVMNTPGQIVASCDPATDPTCVKIRRTGFYSTSEDYIYHKINVMRYSSGQNGAPTNWKLDGEFQCVSDANFTQGAKRFPVYTNNDDPAVDNN